MPADVEAYPCRRSVAFIAEHGLRMQAEGVRVPARRRRGARDPELAAARSTRRGYLGGGWPVEWGGRPDHLPIHDLVLMEELILGDAYRPLDQVMLAAHAIVEFGTDAQKRELLPKIRSGEHVWCQLFSEPDAGSDLASLRTRAVPDGDGFVVTGQKIWSTDAQWADMGMLLARTDPTVDRHAGITAFVIPMDLPGIEVRPIREMTGYAEFCEVFLDGVRARPRARARRGRRRLEGRDVGPGVGAGVRRRQRRAARADVRATWSPWPAAARLPDGTAAIAHEDVQAQLAGARARVEEVKLIVRDTVERILDDDEHPSDGPVAKLAYTEMNVALCELALQLISSSASIDARRTRGRRPLVPQLPLGPRADHLRRRLGDHARPDRPPAPRTSPRVKETTTCH